MIADGKWRPERHPTISSLWVAVRYRELDRAVSRAVHLTEDGKRAITRDCHRTAQFMCDRFNEGRKVRS